MTLPYSPSRAVYEGNGAATSFPFAFKVWSTDQLNISTTSPKGETSPAQGWTANIGESGGTVTYLHDGAPLPAGWRLAIVRNMPFEQGIDLISASRFDPQVIEDGLDQATAELQQLNEKLARAVIMPATSDKSPEEVVASIYSSRDAAAQNATAAAHSAAAAAASAATAAQTVAEAAEASVSAATAQADIAAASAQTAQTAAHAAQQAVPDNLLSRMANAEVKNTQQDTRLNGVESGITAVSTTLIGSIMSITAADSYVPNGAVPADAAEYTREQFRELYDTYLVGGKLLTCTYAAFAAQVALTGNCARFALDTTAQKFKVPLVKNGDSITQAAGAAELGKSVKAGLPNITGSTLGFQAINGSYGAGALYSTGSGGIGFGQSSGGGWNSIGLDANRSNPTYRNDVSTVITEQVRLRHFVVLASAQNSASVFDWSNYMAGLAGKANLDMDNLSTTGKRNIAKLSSPTRKIARRINIAWPQGAAPADGYIYTAPGPGNVCIMIQAVAGSWYSLVGYSDEDPTKATVAASNLLAAPAGNIRASIEVAEGQKVGIAYTAPTLSELYYTPKEGA